MENTKAISPEVKGLFDTIRRQAEQYKEAFVLLENVRQVYEDDRRAAKTLFEKIKLDSDAAIKDVKKQVDETLEIIEAKTDQNIKIYDDLDNVRQLRNSLAALYDKVKKQYYEIDSTLTSVKSKASSELEELIKNARSRSEVELESTLNHVRDSVDKEIDNLMKKLEVRLLLNLKQLESKFLRFDKKLWEISDNQAREYKRLGDLIESLGINLSELRESNAKLHGRIYDQIKRDVNEIMSNATGEKIFEIDNTSSALDDAIEKKEIEPDLNDEKSESKPKKESQKKKLGKTDEEISKEYMESYTLKLHDSEIFNLKRRFRSADEEISKIKNREVLPIVFSIIAFIGTLILLVLNFLI